MNGVAKNSERKMYDGNDDANIIKKPVPLRSISWTESEGSDLNVPGTPRTPRTQRTPGLKFISYYKLKYFNFIY